jgi:hypothetical protein
MEKFTRIVGVSGRLSVSLPSLYIEPPQHQGIAVKTKNGIIKKKKIIASKITSFYNAQNITLQPQLIAAIKNTHLLRTALSDASFCA